MAGKTVRSPKDSAGTRRKIIPTRSRAALADSSRTSSVELIIHLMTIGKTLIFMNSDRTGHLPESRIGRAILKGNGSFILSRPLGQNPFHYLSYASALARNSGCLPDHLNRAARAFFRADATPFAVIVIKSIPLSRAELDHGIIRTKPITVVTLKTVSAG